MRDAAFKPINEPRLVAMLEKKLKEDGRLEENQHLTLRTPPLASDIPGREPPGIHVTVFPTWIVCKAEDAPASNNDVRRRRLVKWQDLAPSGGRQRYETDERKKLEVTPLRFVGACEDGHLQDIDWRWVVHGKDNCREQMWVEERGTSADPRDTRVMCDCGKSMSLQEAFLPGRLGACKGERPWLGDRDPNGCRHQLRLLTRTATNTYFPQVATVISLPAAEDELSRLVEAQLGQLSDVKGAEDIRQGPQIQSGDQGRLRGL
ncbi:hypothetical protein [Caenispirillum bisanense]|uniref:hypothetical protein n=1 Tax=Caenispirillum bisanense TaxID=414052 RepID=UPI0031DEFEC7